MAGATSVGRRGAVAAEADIVITFRAYQVPRLSKSRSSGRRSGGGWTNWSNGCGDQYTFA